MAIGQQDDILVHLQLWKWYTNGKGKRTCYRSYRRMNTLFIHIL